MSATAAERLEAARTALVLDSPYFGRLALHLKFREGGPTNTAATDGRSLFYNAQFVGTCSDDQLVGLNAHEVMHPAMQHHVRRCGRDPLMWNEAADYEINPILIDAGFTLPEGALVDPSFKGLTAEQIYDRLLQRPKTGGGNGDGDDQGAAGAGQGDPGAGDQPGDGSGLANLPGAVLDAPDAAQDGPEWQIIAKEAAQVAKMMGRLPGGVAGMVEAATKPITDWRSILRRFVQQTAAADYSWKRPNRRYLPGGFYLPSLHSEAMPPLVLVADTSGSCVGVFPKVLAHVAAIADDCLPERVYVVQVDAAVQRVDVFERGEPIGTLELKGRGGTDFNPAFDWVQEQGIDPACLIYITDGYGSYPAAPVEYPVIWALVNPYDVPWGESVQIED